MPAYKDTARNTWFTKFCHKDWTGTTRWVTKRGFSTKKEALQWERDFLTEKSGSTDMTFEAFAKIYLRDLSPRIKETTLVLKESIIESKLLPYFGKRMLQDITAQDVIQWQNTLLKHRHFDTGKPYSKVYLKTVHNHLSALFNHAVRFYGLKENPARIAGNMGTESGIEMKFWTREQYQLFAESMMSYPRAYYCFEVLYWCGIRLGEMLALTPNDVDLDKRTISINKNFQMVRGQELITTPKTPKSKRVISIPQFLCEELKDYMSICYDIQPNERLFPVTKSYLHRMLEKGCFEQKLPLIRLHDLRHSHVSLLINMGFDAVAIANRMGHESIDITFRYAHLFPSVQNEMANQLNDLRKDDPYVC